MGKQALEPVRRLCLLLVALTAVAVPIGCSDEAQTTGTAVKPTEGQAQAQSNMEDFMNKQGKGAAKTPAK